MLTPRQHPAASFRYKSGAEQISSAIPQMDNLT
jgi:hypothetical protein